MNNKNKIVQKLAMPSAAKLIVEKNLDINAVIGTGVDGRVTKGDVLLHLNLIKNKTIEEEGRYIFEPKHRNKNHRKTFKRH